MNTAVHQPPGSRAPALIRLARLPGVLQLVCVRTPAFIQVDACVVASRLCARSIRDALSRAVPLGGAACRHRRVRAGHPLDPSHPERGGDRQDRCRRRHTRRRPRRCSCGARRIRCSPISTCVTSMARFPAADVHRFVGASHLVVRGRRRRRRDPRVGRAAASVATRSAAEPLTGTARSGVVGSRSAIR